MSDDFEYQLQQESLEKIAKSESKTYRDPNDGTEYEWNESKKAWFPKIDDDFIAKYQSNYGNFSNQESNDDQKSDFNSIPESDDYNDSEQIDQKVNDLSKKSNDKKQFISKLLNKRKEEPQTPDWFEVSDEHNTNVYVSGLPLDITEEDFVELMKKCGLIMKDDSNELKIKLYRDSNGNLKGDGRCCYIKVESVVLALDILDGYNFNGQIIKVERAKFALKGDYDPNKKPKRRKRDKEKMKKKINKLLDWRPEAIAGERPKCEKTVIIKNMFEPKDFESEPKLILEYRSDLRDECNEKCGEVKRVDIYDCHPEGVAAITFNEFECADQCVTLMNGRYFAGRKLISHVWDGKTKYKIQETEEEAEKRIKQWDQFLEDDKN